MSGDSRLTGGSPHSNNNNDQTTSERNNYVAKPPTFSGDSIEFEWWKSKCTLTS